MEQAQCGHPSIVYDRALQHGWPGDPLESIQVAFTFSQESARKTRKESPYGIQGHVHRCGSAEDPGVGDYCKKLVDAGPGNADGFRRSDRLGQNLSSTIVEGYFRAMRIDEQIRVDSNHAPCSR